jgi:hypothetical protein
MKFAEIKTKISDLELATCFNFHVTESDVFHLSESDMFHVSESDIIVQHSEPKEKFNL